MKLKTLTKFIILAVLTLAIIGGSFATPVFAHTSQRDRLLGYFSSQAGGLQEYIDTTLSQSAGTTNSDWLLIALIRLDEKLNPEAYLKALDSKQNENLNTTDKERLALLCSLCGKKTNLTESLFSLTPSTLTINEAIYALIFLDSNAHTSDTLKRNDLINHIISLQLSDGGWALSGSVYDIDVTAMALQALSPYTKYSDVSAAVSRGISLLSAKQTENGDYKSRGTPTCESTAQVIIALYSLGINPKTDSRFIKNQNDLFDGLATYQTDEGLYSHFANSSANGIATAQAACAITSAHRFEAGKSGIYHLNTPSILREETSSTSASSSESTSISSSSSSYSETQNASSLSASEAEKSNTADIDTAYSAAGNDLFTSATKSISYKYIASAAVIAIFTIICVYLFAKGKATLSRIAAIAVVAMLIIAGILFINITSVKKHYSAELGSATENSKTVTFSINIEAVSDQYPSLTTNGCILPEIKYVISEKSTPFSALLDITLANGIKLVYNGSPNNPLSPVYVTSIASISEKQHGPLSGWIYKINGTSPDLSAGEYILSDGDIVEWVYTTELGKDNQE